MRKRISEKLPEAASVEIKRSTEVRMVVLGGGFGWSVRSLC